MSCATAKKEGSSRYASSIRARSTRLAGSVRERAIAPNAAKSFSPMANSIACRHAVMSSTLSANQSRKPRTHVGNCESPTYDRFHGIDVLVEVANLGAKDLAAAQASAAKVDFRNTSTLLAHGEGMLGRIAQASRQLLTGVRLGDAGDVGRIAASVIDGVKILRIEDLQAEATGGAAPARKGLIGRLIGAAVDAHTAFKGFAENRKKFLDLM